MFQLRFEELAHSLKHCVYTEHQEVISEQKALQETHELLRRTKDSGGIVYVIGNGGSAGIASHFSNDLMKALQIPSQTFYDSNLMTCLSNDIGYAQIFSYPLEKMAKKNDLLVAISSSGKSENILNAVKAVECCNIPVITLSGFSSENPLRSAGTVNFWIDRKDYGLVETAHFFLLHTVIDSWK